MALRDDLGTAVTNLQGAAATLTAAVEQLRSGAGTVPDADIQTAISSIQAVADSLNALAQPPAG